MKNVANSRVFLSRQGEARFLENVMNKLNYVIFDCDGVLVDSEIIANRIEAEVKTALGFPTTVEEQISKFFGHGHDSPTLQAALRRLPKNYSEWVDEKVRVAYDTDLRAVTGIPELLSGVRAPSCVASNSHPDWLELKLSLTGLKPFFGNAVFSGHQVKRSKPAPDLFLYAASMMGWPIKGCLVIEDSIVGVTAGKAAGMVVCGLLAGSHIQPGHAQRLIQAGADYVVSSASSVLRLLSQQ